MEQTPVLIEKYRGFEIYFLADDNEFYADIDYGDSPYNEYEWDERGVVRQVDNDIKYIRRRIDERHDARVAFEWNKFGLGTTKMMPNDTVHDEDWESHHAYTEKVAGSIKHMEQLRAEWEAEQERRREESKKITEMLEPFDYETAPPYYPPIDQT